MIKEKFVNKSGDKAREITFLRMLTGGLIVIIVCVCLLVYRTLGMERTVVVPPSIQKSFWVNSEGVSKSYLEQMAYWYAGLVLTVSPRTGNYQKDLFLRYATPSASARLAADMTARFEFMEKNNTATMFTIQTLSTDEQLMKVAVTGDLETFVGDKRIGVKHSIYVVGFKYVNERLFVNEFKETNEKDIYGVSTPAK